MRVLGMNPDTYSVNGLQTILQAALFLTHVPLTQVMLLNAAKDVTAALSDLINATKNASGKGPTDPAMDSLKSTAKVCCFELF